MQQSAEQVATTDAVTWQLTHRRRSANRRRLGERRLLAERAVRPVRVVVHRVDVNDALEVAAAEDQQPVKALAPQACDPALRVRPRPRCPHGALITQMPSERKT
jgi:hypothetical protein